MEHLVPPGRAMYRNVESLVLASGSPRRAELLACLGIRFRVEASGVEEGSLDGTPAEKAAGWARQKAAAVARRFPGHWVLAADTIVVLGAQIFGKPGDARDARRMLGQLSGRTHEVITGICLRHRDRQIRLQASVRTLVRIRNLTEREIHAYVATGEPLDKAGSYGIQGVGSFLVRSIQGSYTNVVGLPLSETLDWLVNKGVVAVGNG